MGHLKNGGAPKEKNGLRLNYPQTIKVGIAFAIILLFWGAYDFVVPLLLENAYGMSNTMRGLIMGLDNLLSLFLLPLFGRLSDKSDNKLTRKLGKRTPFIIVGTILAAILMVFVPISAKPQMDVADSMRAEYLMEISTNKEVLKERLEMFYGDSKYSDANYLKTNGVEKEEYLNIGYNYLSKEGFLKKTYFYNGQEINKARYDELNKENAQYNKFVSSGMKVWMSEQISDNAMNSSLGKSSLAFYMSILLITLIAMAVFRSPAVALMPDVTPKPLRSQANAIINLAGGVGGALAFVIYTVVLFGNNAANYIIIFSAIAATMLLLLGLFLLVVRERKMETRCREICAEYGLDDEATPVVSDASASPSAVLTEHASNTTVTAEIDTLSAQSTATNGEKKRFFDFYRNKTDIEKAKFKSFLLILASIFMWFMGYNAVSTSLSIYCTKALNLEASVASIVNGISMFVSAIAFIPVGFMAVKIGRRKSILIGFALATVSYVLLFLFVKQNHNALIPAVLFSLFYLVSGFGLIIANVNTFPMVVELASSNEVGKYTGFYYAATMSAQAITPMVAGLVMDYIGMKYLFLYSAVCVVGAIVIMYFVKHGDSKQINNDRLTKEEKKQIMLDSMGDAD